MRSLFKVILIIYVGDALINLKTKWDPVIAEICPQYNVPFALVKAIMRKESNFNPKAHRKTEKEDSYGLMQLNWPTATALGYVGARDGLFDPRTNINLACKLLRELMQRYPANIMDVIAAYNAGSVRYLKSAPLYINSGYVTDVYARYLLYNLFGVFNA